MSNKGVGVFADALFSWWGRFGVGFSSFFVAGAYTLSMNLAPSSVFTKFVTKDADSSDLSPYLREANKFAVEAFGEPIIPLDGAPSTEIIDSLSPIEGEQIVKKSGSSAFTNTNLHSFLKSRSIKQIVLAGVFTNFCVENTARSGFDLGYEVLVAEDACAAPAPQLHDNSVAAMEIFFAAIEKTEKLIGKNS